MTPDYVFPGLGRAARRQAGAAGRAGARHPPAVRGDALRAADHRRPHQERRGEDDPLRRRRGARRLHAVGGLGRSRRASATASASPEQREKANKHRALAVLFGDGAGALIFRATDRDAGLRGMKLHTDGGAAELLYVPGGGFRTRPYWKHSDFDEQAHIPQHGRRGALQVRGDEAARRPRARCAPRRRRTHRPDRLVSGPPGQRRASTSTSASSSACPPRRCRSNIERFGNTSAGTLPILIDEQMRAGKLKHGDLYMLLALGAGIHWGLRARPLVTRARLTACSADSSARA